MTTAERRAFVVCFGETAGTLESEGTGMSFAYDSDWIDRGHPPLSLSLPLDGSFSPAQATAFFGGLLPEGEPRELLARRLGLSVDNDFSLLTAVGGDTAGAISILPEGSAVGAGEALGDGVVWLDDEGIAELIDTLPRRPMHADDDGEWRLSLAGAQDKLPVVVSADGVIGLTRGRTPSTHILKTPIVRLEDTVANEAFCLAFGRALDNRRAARFSAVDARPIAVLGRETLLVARYDRIDVGGRTQRLHQEDFCQALGVPTARKYESEGGPGLADGVDLIRRAGYPAGVSRFVDYLILNFLVGNHDAHGKNFSLLYGAGDRRGTLAPAYDVLSTVAYHGQHRLTRKMAMRIGGEYRPEYVRERHLDRLCGEAGLGRAATRKRIGALATRAPEVADRTRVAFRESGWHRPVIDEIVAIIRQRAAMLTDIAGRAGNA